MGRTNTTNNDDLGLKQVSSATGFSAGDLIYETGSGIGKIPSGTGGNANFSATGELKASGPSAGSKHGFARNLNITASGVGNGEYVCKLSSGKIAVVYYRAKTTNTRANGVESMYVYMRIYNEDGTINVAETAVTTSTTYQWVGDVTYPMLCVCQLTGGNIVVAWGMEQGSNTYCSYAVHNGTTGAQITAPTQLSTTLDGSTASIKSCLRIEPLTGGNCVIAWASEANTNMYHTIINSTGGSVLSARSLGQSYVGASKRDSLSICAREDGNYCVLHAYSGGYYFHIFDSSGTQVAVDSNSGLSGGNIYGSWMTRDSNNQMNMFMLNSGYVYHMTVASGATNLQNLTSIFQNSDMASFGGGSGQLGAGTYNYGMLRAHCISGTTKNIVYVNVSYGGMDRLLYINSDGSEAASPQVIGGVACNGFVRGGSFVDLTNDVRFYTNSGTLDNQQKPETPPSGIFYYTINKTALNVGGGSGVTGNLGTATAASGAYSESGSTVKKGGFLALADGSTSTTNVRTTGATLIKGETLVGNTNATDGYDLDGRIGGGFFVVQQEDATVYVHVFDINYNLEKTVTVTTNAASSSHYQCFICQLGNGKVVVAYGNASGSTGTSGSKFKIYNAAMDTVLVEEMSFGVNVTMTQGYPQGLQGLMGEDGDEFAFAWTRAYGYGQIGVWKDDGTKVWGDGTLGRSDLASYTAQSFILCALPNGDIGVAYNTNGYNSYFFGVWRKTVDGTTWYNSEISTLSVSSYSGHDKRSWKSFSGPSGIAGYSIVNSSGYWRYIQHAACDHEFVQFENSYATYNQGAGTWGVAGNMAPFCIIPMSGYTNIFTWSVKINDNTNLNINSYSNVRPTTSNTYNHQTIPLNGHEAAWFYSSTNSVNGALKFFVVRTMDEVTNIGYTTSTACDPIALDDPSKRAIFLGVAVTDCPAGGSGTIQTKGNGKIGTSYKDASTAENFNFESHSGNGKAGSQVGRSVIIRE